MQRGCISLPSNLGLNLLRVREKEADNKLNNTQVERVFYLSFLYHMEGKIKKTQGMARQTNNTALTSRLEDLLFIQLCWLLCFPHSSAAFRELPPLPPTISVKH